LYILHSCFASNTVIHYSLTTKSEMKSVFTLKELLYHSLD